MKFFFKDKNGEPSSRKVWAFIFCIFEIIDKGVLILHPAWHYSTFFHYVGVSDAVVITLIASMDAMALGALTVYGWKSSAMQTAAPETIPATAPAGSDTPQTPGDVK